mgnify:CR=1 FL=1
MTTGTMTWHVPYRASLAQWHAERAVELGRAKLVTLLGGIGSGKTTLGQHVLRRVMSEWAPGSRSMIITPSYRTFGQVTLPEIRKWWPGEGVLWRYHAPASQPQITWYWGDGTRSIESTCVIRSAQDARTVEEIRGPTLAYILGDEVGTWNAGETAHNLAFGRLRQQPPSEVEDIWALWKWWPRALYVGSPRWGWLNRALGIKGRMPPQAWTTGFFPVARGKPSLSYYVRATRTEENTHNGPDYAQTLRLLYGEAFASQELDGDFVSPTGAVYPMYYETIHRIPHGVAMDLYRACSRKVGGVDWGFTQSAMVALGLDDDGRAVVVREWCKGGYTDDQMGAIAREWEEELGITDWYCDSEDKAAINRWKGRVEGSRAVTGRVHLADKAVDAGRNTVRNCMRLESKLRHPSGNAEVPGSWYYQSASCTQLHDATQALRYADTTEGEERDERKVKPKSATHLSDARRYAIHSALATAVHRTAWENF